MVKANGAISCEPRAAAEHAPDHRLPAHYRWMEDHDLELRAAARAAILAMSEAGGWLSAGADAKERKLAAELRTTCDRLMTAVHAVEWEQSGLGSR